MRNRSKCALIALVLLNGNSSGEETAHQVLTLSAPVQDRNFYVLSLLERSPEVTNALAGALPLRNILRTKQGALEKARASCSAVSCFDEALRWTDAEIATAAEALEKLFLADAAVRKVTDQRLRSSGAYVFGTNQRAVVNCLG